jgi:hypothetical protein
MELGSNSIPGFSLSEVRETLFFSHHDGHLSQWLDADVDVLGPRKSLDFTIVSRKQKVTTSIVLNSPTDVTRHTIRLHAPVCWPNPEDSHARLLVRGDNGSAEGVITIGRHRPWTVYVLSDLCADDTWAYGDLEAHDQDDYLTTCAELGLGPDNAYNFATSYQVHRFLARCTAQEEQELNEALREKRFYISPVPNQLLCGLFTLATYPLLIEPYAALIRRFQIESRVAYHMEATTWSNGLVSLLHGAGFRLFAKSLLRYQAPWLDHLQRMPRLTRLESSPGCFVYLLLRVDDYYEALPILAGLSTTNRFLHGHVIPAHEDLHTAYPVSCIPLVGMYSDLSPQTQRWGEIKKHHIDEYNGQGWEYPRLVNASWDMFLRHLEEEMGQPERPRRTGLVTVEGSTGSSWEVWTLAAESEAARFRRAQIDVVSLRTLDALSGLGDGKNQKALDEAAFNMVQLGDHAWNGSSDSSKEVNLAIRRRRLDTIERKLEEVRDRFTGPNSWHRDSRLAVVNTLGWQRTCSVAIPPSAVNGDLRLSDSGETIPILKQVWGEQHYALVPDVPAFGARSISVWPGPGKHASTVPQPSALLRRLRSMLPVLCVQDRELPPIGGWKDAVGSWTAGPFDVRARAMFMGGYDRLDILVKGKPPEEPYELTWQFVLPWKTCRYRGDSGGGFSTAGPAEKNGGALLGIVGSVYSCGSGISARSVNGAEVLDLAFEESGILGLGGRTTPIARGHYHERVGKDLVRQAVLSSTAVPGELHWYLLATSQNPSEAIPHQGGARSWRWSCATRFRSGGFDDQQLYQFATGFRTQGEIVAGIAETASRLVVSHAHGVIILGLQSVDSGIRIDLYNSDKEERSVILSGPVSEGKRVYRCDMLGRTRELCPRGEIRISGRAYQRVVLASGAAYRPHRDK